MTSQATTSTVIVVDDEAPILSFWRHLLRDLPYNVVTFQEPLQALDFLGREPADAAVVDLIMPGMDGMELLHQLKSRDPDLQVVMMTGKTDGVEAAVQAVRQGAYDFLKKSDDLDPARVAVTIRRAVEATRARRQLAALEQRVRDGQALARIVGQSHAISRVKKNVRLVAQHDTTVLIQGESGTGKELVARAVHEHSSRARGPFRAVNMSACAPNLIESDLFGHEKGAFTGAVGHSLGIFRSAEGGTVFLDEIGDMPLAAQKTLLRVLQEREVRPVGRVQPVKVDVRIIAATNRDLAAEVAAGRFRQDLYFRLNNFPIQLPPLRDRPEDIDLLAYHFIRQHARKMGRERPIETIDHGALETLRRHAWPGNVRELENMMERAVIMAHGTTLTAADLPPEIDQGRPAARPAQEHTGSGARLVHLAYAEAKQLVLESFAQDYLTALLERHDGNMTRAARAAGMERANFRRLCKGFGVTPRRGQGDAPPRRPRRTQASAGGLLPASTPMTASGPK